MLVRGANFFRRIQLGGKAPHIPEGVRPAKDKRPGRPAHGSRQQVPDNEDIAQQGRHVIEPNQAAASGHPAAPDSFQQLGQCVGVKPGIGVYKQKPVPASDSRPRVAGAGNLIDGFEDHARPRRTGQLRGAVG